MLELHLFHGRKEPNEEMDDWGFSGPTITGIVSMHGTYDELRVRFDTTEDVLAAHQKMGWTGSSSGMPPTFNRDMELIIPTYEDMVVTWENGEKNYYGDWILTVTEAVAE
jgi:hypothetical protein